MSNQEKSLYSFEFMPTPVWANPSDIYFNVKRKDVSIGYIGLQDLDFSAFTCDNICYKTKKSFRGKGYSKEYFDVFINDKIPFKFNRIKAKVLITNIASQKMLEKASTNLNQ